MEATIIIDGVSVRFRKTGGTAIRYLECTGRELNSDLASYFDAITAASRIEDDMKKALAIMKIDTKWIYDFLYIMAKKANPNIPEMLDWLDGFDDFDVHSIMLQLMPMLKKESQVSPKNG